VGRVWGPLSLRQRAGIALAVWSIAFAVLAVATAVPSGPTARLSVDDASPIVDQTVHFDASMSEGHDRGLGRIVSYRFDFGDGMSTADQTSPYTGHAYAASGTTHASVTARDARGYEGSADLTVTIRSKPPPTGSAPDLAPVAAAIVPAMPIAGQVVSLSITIMNHGAGPAESATVDVTDERPNGTIVSIGQTALPSALAAGSSVVVYSESFLAVGVGVHNLTIVVGNVSPEENYTADNTLTIRMIVSSTETPPPPPSGGFSLGTAIIVALLIAAAIAAFVGSALLLRRPKRPGPLAPPPQEPPDQSPPPIWPP